MIMAIVMAVRMVRTKVTELQMAMTIKMVMIMVVEVAVVVVAVVTGNGKNANNVTGIANDAKPPHKRPTDIPPPLLATSPPPPPKHASEQAPEARVKKSPSEAPGATESGRPQSRRVHTRRGGWGRRRVGRASGRA